MHVFAIPAEQPLIRAKEGSGGSYQDLPDVCEVAVLRRHLVDQGNIMEPSGCVRFEVSEFAAPACPDFSLPFGHERTYGAGRGANPAPDGAIVLVDAASGSTGV